MARGFRNAKKYFSYTHEEEKESFWVSYTDLMSALLIVFALVLMIALFNMQKTFEETQAVIKQKEEAIDEKNKMIEEVVGVKTRIIKELVKVFQDSDLDMQVDPQTGAIRFSGGVFFATNSSEISPTGKQYLEKFIPKYIGILLSDQFRNEISQIIVEGHTDTQGGYLFNLKLSQNRALAVVEQIYSPSFPNFRYRNELNKVITANGRSFSMPMYKSDGTIDADKSRRVEFKFRLKDDQLLEKIQTMVNENGK
ncbi:OmpA family protein [Brevibacillus sp. H7]|uniref:OmpA family protein n=1 Tax=Brevibacillus sp. H7 TaxID=3349138 RepID=UPI0037FF7B1C